MDAVVYSDGGKNRDRGCYGSFLVTVDGEEKRHKEFEYESLKTANDAEVETLMQALIYIKNLNTQFPGRVNWTVNVDSGFLYGHVTKNGRKVAKKFQPAIKKAKNIIFENDIKVYQVSGELMKEILGH